MKQKSYIPPKTIISGFAGIGKTFASSQYDNVIDLESSKFFFHLPMNMTKLETERLKGDTNRKYNPNGLSEYINAIIDAYQKYDYVLIAMFPELLNRLYELGLDVQLVLPKKDDKLYYKSRYESRENQVKWIDSMMTNWDNYIDSTINNNRFTKKPIILDTNETLSDIIDGKTYNKYDNIKS